jgi:hypothetical protein
MVGSFASIALALAGCSNTPAAVDTGAGGNDAGNDAATVSMTDAGSDAGGGGTDSGGGGADSGCDGVLLTVHNYLAWCSVSINGGTTSTAGTQTVCVPANTEVPLVHTAASSSFILGTWHHTDGDTGTGEAGTVSGSMSSTTVQTDAVGTTACVWVCCPFPDGTGCDVADQCT